MRIDWTKCEHHSDENGGGRDTSRALPSGPEPDGDIDLGNFVTEARLNRGEVQPKKEVTRHRRASSEGRFQIEDKRLAGANAIDCGEVKIKAIRKSRRRARWWRGKAIPRPIRSDG
jgi:hypothetical protein